MKTPFATVHYNATHEPAIVTTDRHVARSLRQAGYVVRALGPWLWEACPPRAEGMLRSFD
jgi:hypothetical protein